MSEHFTAVYEQGVFRPLSPISLPEQSTVELQVVRDANPDWLDQEAHGAAESEQGTGPTLDEVRRRLAVVHGSLADDVIALRGEY